MLHVARVAALILIFASSHHAGGQEPTREAEGKSEKEAVSKSEDPSLTKQQFYKKVDDALEAFRSFYVASTEEWPELSSELDMAKAMKALDDGKRLLEVRAKILKYCEQTIKHMKDYKGLLYDQGFLKAASAYGTRHGDWVVFNFGAMTYKSNLFTKKNKMIAGVVYLGKSAPTAAKLSVEWLDAFGDVVGSASSKQTSILTAHGLPNKFPAQGAKSTPAYFAFLTDLETPLIIIESAGEAPSHVQKARDATIRVKDLKEVR